MCNWVHRCESFGFVLVALSCAVLLEVPVLAQKQWTNFVWSTNANFVARIFEGDDSSSQKAYIHFLAFNHDSGGLEFITELQLENEYKPDMVIVSNDGRYLVTIGNRSKKAELDAAVVIYDVKDGSRKVFGLTDLFRKEDLPGEWNSFQGKFAEYVPVFGLSWFLLDRVEVDDDKQRIYVTGLNKLDEKNPPTLVICWNSKTARVESPDFWKLKHDQRSYYAELTDKQFDAILTGTQRCFLTLVRSSTWTPSISYLHVGGTVVARLEPGAGETNARIRLLEQNSHDNGFSLIREISLENPEAPAYWVFSKDLKYLVTIDEWNKIGSTANVVVIYNLQTNQRRAYALEDFCTKAEIDRMLATDNVRLWRLAFGQGILLKGAEFPFWEKRAYPEIVPTVTVDVAKMEVTATPVQMKRGKDF